MMRFSISVFFFLYFIPVLAIYSDTYKFEVIQLLVIYTGFLVGVIASVSLSKNKQVKDHFYRYRVDNEVFYLLFVLYVLCKSSSLIELVQVIVNGDFSQWALAKALNRYENFEEVSKVTFFQRLGTLSFLMSGSIIASLSGKKKMPILMMFIMVFNESASLARLGVLLVFISTVVEVVIRNNYKIQKFSLYQLIKVYFYIFILLMAIFSFSAYYRVSTNDDAINIVINKLGIYTLAMYEALFSWMQGNSSGYGSGNGFYTFAGVFKMFGVEVQQGFYGLTNTRFGNTNIYTSIRGFLSDFGLFGTSFLFMLIGFITTVFCFHKLNFFTYNLLRFIYFLFLFCLFSPFIHFNTFVAYIISGLICSTIPIGFFKLRK